MPPVETGELRVLGRVGMTQQHNRPGKGQSIFNSFSGWPSHSPSLLYFIIHYFNPQPSTGQLCFASPSEFTEKLNQDSISSCIGLCSTQRPPLGGQQCLRRSPAFFTCNLSPRARPGPWPCTTDVFLPPAGQKTALHKSANVRGKTLWP